MTLQKLAGTSSASTTLYGGGSLGSSHLLSFQCSSYGTYSNENIFKRPRRALLDLIGNANTRTELSTMWNFLNNFVIVVCGHQQEDFLLQQVSVATSYFIFLHLRLLNIQVGQLLYRNAKVQFIVQTWKTCQADDLSPATVHTVGGKISTLVRFM